MAYLINDIQSRNLFVGTTGQIIATDSSNIRVGIGVSNPQDTLHIGSFTAGGGIRLDTDGAIKFQDCGRMYSFDLNHQIHFDRQNNNIRYIEGGTQQWFSKLPVTGHVVSDTPTMHLNGAGLLIGYSVQVPASKLHIYNDDVETGISSGLMVEQAGTGDARMSFLVSGLRWNMGIDNSDNDRLKISYDPTGNVGISTVLSIDVFGTINLQQPVVVDRTGIEALLVRKAGDTGDVFVVDTSNRRVGVGPAAPTALFNVYEDTSETGAAAGIQIENDGTGDAVLHFHKPGALRFNIGLDNTDNNFKISSNSGGDVGIAPLITINSGGGVTFISNIILDTTSTEALVIRQDADALDVFTVDTTNNVVKVSTGRVGIGVSAPTAGHSLHLGGFGAGKGLLLDTDGTIAFTDCGRIQWYTDGNHQIIFDRANDVLRFVEFGRFAWFVSRDIKDIDHVNDPNMMTLGNEGLLVGFGGITAASTLHVYNNDTETGTSAGIVVEQDGTGDARMSFLLTGGQRWNVGLDNSDNDRLKISYDSGGDLGVSTVLIIGQAELKSIISTVIETTSSAAFVVRDFNADRTAFCVDTTSDIFQVGVGTATPNSTFEVRNSDNLTDFQAGIEITNDSAGDAVLHFHIPGLIRWNIGVDRSDGNLLKISRNTGGDVGDTTKFAMSSSGTTMATTLVLDTTSTEALVVRQAGDVLDVFTVDTTNNVVKVSTGRVGIGVSAPTSGHSLHLGGFAAGGGLKLDAFGAIKWVQGGSMTSQDSSHGIYLRAQNLSEQHYAEFGAHKFFTGVYDPKGIPVLSITGAAMQLEIKQIIQTTNTEALLVRKAGDTGDVFVVDTSNRRVGVGPAAPTARFNVYEDTSETGAAAGIQIENDGTGDAVLHFHLPGANRWNIGVDNSDNNSLKISSHAGGDVGIIPLISMNTAGGVTFVGNMILDNSSTEALLVRKAGDTRDVFVVDTITGLGRVGIGVSSPGDSLHIGGFSAGGGLKFEKDATIFFQDCGQIMSADANHQILFNRVDNEIRFAEFGAFKWYGGLYADSDTPVMNLNSAGLAVGYRSDISGTGNASATLHVYSDDTAVGTSTGLLIEQDGTGDARMSFLLTGGQRFNLGIDNTNDRFKISADSGGDLGVTELFNISATFGAVFTCGLLVNGGFNVQNQEGLDKFVVNASSGAISFPGLTTTTGTAANVVIEGGGILKTVSSSRRYKQDIKQLTDQESGRLHQMQPVTYRSRIDNDQKQVHYGFIAEQIEEVDPKLVSYKNGRVESVHYGRMCVLLTAEVQKLRRDLDRLMRSS